MAWRGPDWRSHLFEIRMPTMTRPTVLVLGAAGRFGAAATSAFAVAGWRVLAQARRALAAAPHVEHVDIALERGADLAQRAAGATTVVYAVNPPYTRWDSELLPLFEHGLGVAERLGARLVLPGNVYAYGEGMPPLLTPQTPERPTTRKGELRAAMEQRLRELAGAGRLSSVVLRAGDFFGGGRGSWLDLAIVKSLMRGKLVFPGPLDVPHAWAYLPDLARACAEVAATALPAGHARLHFAGHTASGRDLLGAIDAAAASLGARPAAGFRHGSVPWPLLRAAGVFVPMLRELATMSYLWRVPHALDGSALQSLLGHAPHGTPLVEALRVALAGLGLGAASAPAPPPVPLRYR